MYQAVCFGEVLWDILPDGKEAGGAPLNVCYHLQNNGIPSAIISKVGKDENGKELKDLLMSRHVTLELLETDDEYPTGRVNVQLQPSGDALYDIVYPVAYDFIDATPFAIESVKSSRYFIYGSLAGRNQISRNALSALLEVSDKKIFDINLRYPHYNRDYILQLLKKANILKLNLEELAQLNQWIGGQASEKESIRRIQSEFDLELILLSKGSGGATVYGIEESYTLSVPLQKPIVNTIGCGDALLAGFIAGLELQRSISEALEKGMELASWVAGHAGACPDYAQQRR